MTSEFLHIALVGCAFGVGFAASLVFIGLTVSLAHALAKRLSPERNEEEGK